MEMHVKRALVVVVIAMLVSCSPTDAWYKQVTGPSYYSVGRASGLLSGIRRSPYIKRAEPDSSDNGETNSMMSDLSPQNFILKTMPVCVKDVRPNLQNCELQDAMGLFKCKADVFVSLDSSDCAEA